MSVIEIFGEDANKKELPFPKVIEKYLIVFRNMTNALRLQMTKAIITQSVITLND